MNRLIQCQADRGALARFPLKRVAAITALVASRGMYGTPTPAQAASEPPATEQPDAKETPCAQDPNP